MNIQDVIDELNMNAEFKDDGPHSYLTGVVDILLEYINEPSITDAYNEIG